MLAPHNPANSPFLGGLPARNYYCWGCTPRRLDTFMMIDVGDQILLSENKSRLLNFMGVVRYKLPYPDRRLANHIWGSHHENIMIIESVLPKTINKNDFVDDLYGNCDTLTSPRYIGPNNPDKLADWARYNVIRGRYGL
jgi:hypothetical protein